MRLALVNAGVSPHNIAALELHGTGTPLGDPIEVRSPLSTLHMHIHRTFLPQC